MRKEHFQLNQILCVVTVKKLHERLTLSHITPTVHYTRFIQKRFKNLSALPRSFPYVRLCWIGVIGVFVYSNV